jgi:putative transcriptional regulator
MKNNIKQLRKEAGLRQEDMAERLGVSRQTIIAIENDKYNPTLELAMKIARLLNKTVEEIFVLPDNTALNMIK